VSFYINNENLSEYAEDMKSLGDFWQKTQSVPENRLQWFRNTIEEYFENRMNKIFEKLVRTEIFKTEETPVKKLKRHPPIFSANYKVLDVGSSFNPLGNDKKLEVTAVDLSPANSLVRKCDFLSKSDRLKNSLSESSFDVLIFSLFLSYRVYFFYIEISS